MNEGRHWQGMLSRIDNGIVESIHSTRVKR
jgi:hypothetical protein